MTGFLFIISILAGSASLWWGFSSVGLSFLINWVPLFGVLWLLAAWNGQRWVSWVGLVLYISLAALGLWLRLAPGWMFSAGIFAFAAWDLGSFRWRLKFIILRHERDHAERIHLAKLSVLMFFGLAFGAGSMWLRGVFTAEWGYFLSGVALLLLGQLIWGIRRASR